MFGSAQQMIVVLISVAAFVGAVWALIDAMRYSPAAYTAAGKQTKPLWAVILGVAVLVTFISLPWPLGQGGGVIGIIGVAAIIAIVYYFVDVRVRLQDNRRGISGGGW